MDHTKLTTHLFNKFAQLYQDKYMDTQKYHQSFDLFCRWLADGPVKILEVGCGPGNVSHYLLGKRSELDLLGIDLASKMIDLAKINNPQARFEIMDARHIAQLKGPFQGIMAGFCLPYFSKKEALEFIEAASHLLNPKGILYLSTMEGEDHLSGYKSPSSGGDDRLYIHYHQADYLIESLQDKGFQQIHQERVVTEEDDGSTTIDLILIAQKADTR